MCSSLAEGCGPPPPATANETLLDAVSSLSSSSSPSSLSLTWQQSLGTAFAIWLVYAACLAVYRLYLSPIAHIPGPKIAALTVWYEAYYDVVVGGHYIWKVMDMHKKYGPVVRINPWEVHVSDPSFHSTLYGTTSKPRHKWAFFTKQFGAPYSILATQDHYHHKLRRSALSPFFAPQTVRKLQPVIEARVDALLKSLAHYAGTKSSEPIDIIFPLSAFTNDVINEFAFARSDRLTDAPNFGGHITTQLLTGTKIGNVLKHANWIFTLLTSLPEGPAARFIPGWSGWLKLQHTLRSQVREIQEELTAAGASPLSPSSPKKSKSKWSAAAADADEDAAWSDEAFRGSDHPTIFHDLLMSDVLPPEEKSIPRLAQEAQILVQGGTLTASWALAVGLFHLLHRPSTLRRLRDELFAALPDPSSSSAASVPLATLERLPYFRAVVKESLRHSIGTSTRLSRIAPDEAFTVHDARTGRDVVIPPNTVVSMCPWRSVMDPDVYEEPEVFRPERWIEGDTDRLEASFQVWGGGSRKCLGQNLAQAEMMLLLAKLLRRWGSGGRVGGDGSDADRRDGDVGVMRLYETTPRDVQLAMDYLVPLPYEGSKGVRVVFELC
ncbi:Trichodiene oxygenase [Escovopsis weberi]|uniref:Trichodiene oxygenase n=1 Tax=Escovopsis weberi TaxID=150374 RepID=A0A0M8MSM7_ESCWE|nr:Trichodiene oxygenase [Escovopsis weberi]